MMNPICFRGRMLGAFALLFAALPVFAQTGDVEIVRAFPDLTFEQPLGIASDGTSLLYVSEYAGRVLVFDRTDPAAGTSVFLDLTDRVGDQTPQGQFYSVAFHPDYAQNGYVFVSYLAGGEPYRSVVARYTRSASNPLSVDPASEFVLFDLVQTHLDHNGGDLAFDAAGYLNLVFGDGECCGDPLGNSQDRSTLFGSFLRIDVDNPSGGLNYGIPPDNPYVGNTEGWREEIWAYGVRNPWQFSLDRVTGELWMGDVGGLDWEEVNVIEAGGNYGWPIMEGPECRIVENCDPEEFDPPVWSYSHDEGISVTGGYVYRGSDAPLLYGKYVYADWGFEKMWALDFEDPDNLVNTAFAPPEGSPTPGAVTSFGEDEEGELYFTTFFRGWIYKFESDPLSNALTPERTRLELKPAFPNPFRGEVKLQFLAEESGRGVVTAYDMLGRQVALVFDGAVLSNRLYDVRFDAQNLPAGLYFFRVEVGGDAATTKAVRVR